MNRRLTSDRRSSANSLLNSEQRNGQDRRASNDRRLPMEERLRTLRAELREVLRRQIELVKEQQQVGSI